MVMALGNVVRRDLRRCVPMVERLKHLTHRAGAASNSTTLRPLVNCATAAL